MVFSPTEWTVDWIGLDFEKWTHEHLWFVFLTQQQRLKCVDVFISMRSASARTPVDCSELHKQPVDAVFCPTFVQKLCYKLPSTVSVTFIQTSKFCILYWTASKLAHLLDTASKFVIFGVQFERRKVNKKAYLYMKTETCKLYSRVLWTKISSKLIRIIFDTQCSFPAIHLVSEFFTYSTV